VDERNTFNHHQASPKPNGYQDLIEKEYLQNTNISLRIKPYVNTITFFPPTVIPKPII
jgi:hypothetical protein